MVDCSELQVAGRGRCGAKWHGSNEGGMLEEKAEVKIAIRSKTQSGASNERLMQVLRH